MPTGASDEVSQRVRDALRKLLRDRFEQNQSLAAKALGVKQGTLSDFLAKKKRLGPKLIEGLVEVAPDIVADAFGVQAAMGSAGESTKLTRYSARERAVRAQVMLGITEERARTAADAAGVALKHHSGPTARAWFDAIEMNLRHGPDEGEPVEAPKAKRRSG